ncbi:MAG: hypothetical protein EB120_09740 [Proteobacteria bacterium]|nr:hypothetical protein [Pseudomonadota bacterium]NDC25625.1 hypothetical protein [Pseudomonadota bacterium]NDG27441.1 hypothetical protein [Pseudomonadota bacterium]
MVRVVFKNLEQSVLAREAAEESLEDMVERFPGLSKSTITVTLSMDNSPRQPGPDVFQVITRITGGKYHGIILSKSASSLYTALAEVREHLLERINRKGDKIRLKNRTQERKFVSRNT